MDGARYSLAVPYRNSVLWSAWFVCLGIWTVALLTTYPVHVKDAVFSPQAGYPAAKLLHVSAYAFLAGSAAWLPASRRFRLAPLLLLSLHAFATEYLQQFVEARTGCLADVA